MSAKKKLQLILFLLISTWLVTIFNDFIIPRDSAFEFLGFYLDKLSSHVCHQNPAKLIEFNLHRSSVCSRCAGIYSGAFFASLILVFSVFPKLDNKHLIVAVIILSLDVLFVNSGLYSYQKSIAFSSGIILGYLSFVYLYASLENLLTRNKPDKNH